MIIAFTATKHSISAHHPANAINEEGGGGASRSGWCVFETVLRLP